MNFQTLLPEFICTARIHAVYKMKNRSTVDSFVFIPGSTGAEDDILILYTAINQVGRW